jgi:type VI secretion system secreted protein VgrG
MERLVDSTTPLGAALWFREMSGSEALSGLFDFDIKFHSKQSGLSAKAMLGKDITLKVETEGGKGVRHFNGICTRFGSGGREGEHLVYTAKIRPWLWLAGKRSDCKIFQFKKVPDIISEVLGRYGFALSLKIKKTYREWDYCVQYQETDLNFVMRLMEHEGIYFYFEHQEGSHTLVLADDASCHSALPGKSSIKYLGVDAAAVADEEHFNSWQVLEEVHSGEYITDDYDFTNPRADLKTKRKNPMGHTQDGWERYMWPGGYVKVGDGETYTGVRLESLESEYERTQGQTTVRTMATGYLFNLERCPRADQNREYLAIASTYYFRNNTRMSSGGGGGGDSTWQILVTAQPTSLPYRPQHNTPKPLTHGPQTAVVVGPPGEEIYTDKYGRVKVQFFWEQVKKKNETSSCWIRVSHPWAGEKWGFVHIPRIGQEVIVDFLGGDPDYPVITGRVYNADQMPPYALPDNKTASGIKSRSTKGGGPTDFNEIRMEDLKGKEQLYVHAQRNLDTVVEANESRVIGHDRQTRIGHDDSRFVVNDDKHVIKGNQAVQVEGNQSVTVKANQDNSVNGSQTNMVKGSRAQSVGGKLSEATDGDHRESVGGDHTSTVSGDEKNNINGKQSNFIQGGLKKEGRRTTIVGKDVVTATAKISHFAAMGYSVSTPLKYSLQCTTRETMVLATDKTQVIGKQTLEVGAMRDTTVVGADKLSVVAAQTTTVGGLQSTTVTGASSLSAAVVSITGLGAVSVTGGAAVTVTGATVTVTAPVINLVGIVNVVGMLNVAGTIITPSIVSATYTPGIGNLF